jgi:hypothetical protein
MKDEFRIKNRLRFRAAYCPLFTVNRLQLIRQR